MGDSAKTLIIVVGPTAVGKTSCAISLAQRFGTEIISADSRQCYKGMSIGTAQATIEERSLVPHHFVDCFSVEESLTAADFERFALDKLDTIFQNSDYAILCGGTGLYIKALCEGLDDMPAVDMRINEQVTRQFEQLGIEWLKLQLAEQDPNFAEKGEMQNPMRMLRALTFKMSSGQSILDFRKGVQKQRPFRMVNIALELPREILYNRINLRVDMMMQQGLLREVEALLPFQSLKNLQTVGYSELFDYLNNKCSLAFAVEKIKQHSRNYAKRQTTWFKKYNDFTFFQADDPELINKICKIV